MGHLVVLALQQSFTRHWEEEVDEQFSHREGERERQTQMRTNDTTKVTPSQPSYIYLVFLFILVHWFKQHANTLRDSALSF